MWLCDAGRQGRGAVPKHTMGNCCGTPEEAPPKPAPPVSAPTIKEAAPPEPVKPKEPVPDPGLEPAYRAVKSLGKGGTGDTWLYIDRATGEELAVKLMKRPLPKVIELNIQREIRVSSHIPGPLQGFPSCMSFIE